MSYFGMSSGFLTFIQVFAIVIGGFFAYALLKIGATKVGIIALAFAFGGVFVAIGANPAKGAPNGYPDMVYLGLALYAIGILAIVGTFIVLKIDPLGKKTKNISWIIIACVVALIIIGTMMAFSTRTTPSKTYSTNPTVNVAARCPNCGTEWRNSSFIFDNGRCKRCKNWKQPFLKLVGYTIHQSS